MREDIRKAIKFVEKAVMIAFSLGLLLGSVIGGLTVYSFMR